MRLCLCIRTTASWTSVATTAITRSAGEIGSATWGEINESVWPAVSWMERPGILSWCNSERTSVKAPRATCTARWLFAVDSDRWRLTYSDTEMTKNKRGYAAL